MYVIGEIKAADVYFGLATEKVTRLRRPPENLCLKRLCMCLITGSKRKESHF